VSGADQVLLLRMVGTLLCAVEPNAATDAAGILGENLVIPPFLTTSVDKFWLINATAFIM
jgi:hypothetical protein